FPIGSSTPGCLGSLEVSMGSLPVSGNADFAAVATRAPANAITFVGIALASAPAPLSIGGISYWLDPASSVVMLSSTNALGVARQSLALPAWLGAGMSLGFQFAWVDPCGPQGVTASNAVVFVTQ